MNFEQRNDFDEKINILDKSSCSRVICLISLLHIISLISILYLDKTCNYKYFYIIELLSIFGVFLIFLQWFPTYRYLQYLTEFAFSIYILIFGISSFVFLYSNISCSKNSRPEIIFSLFILESFFFIDKNYSIVQRWNSNES
jgi:hypothetical protein